MRIALLAMSLGLAACGGEQSSPDGKQAAKGEKPGGEAEKKPAAEEKKPAAEEKKKPDAEEKKPDIYDVEADVPQLIQEALARAETENKLVMLMYGGNWCGWCHKLHELFDSDEKIKKTLSERYILVMVDSHTNEATAKKYGADLAKGVPLLTVLGSDGKVKVHQETGSLEEGDHHDPVKVLAFLESLA